MTSDEVMAKLKLEGCPLTKQQYLILVDLEMGKNDKRFLPKDASSIGFAERLSDANKRLHKR